LKCDAHDDRAGASRTAARTARPRSPRTACVGTAPRGAADREPTVAVVFLQRCEQVVVAADAVDTIMMLLA
jgi:hypothetical protein